MSNHITLLKLKNMMLLSVAWFYEILNMGSEELNLKDNEEPLLVGGINYEIRDFFSKELVLEEFIEGVISYRSKNIGKEFLDEIKNYLTEEKFKQYLGSKKPFFYIVLSPEDMEIYMYAEGFIDDMYEFKEYEKRILESVAEDLA